jgi:hypothetical protein
MAEGLTTGKTATFFTPESTRIHLEQNVVFMGLCASFEGFA